MIPSKDTCNYLKAIRRNIAQENEIDLEIPECTYMGECLGTCPQCEAEVRFLETELARRISLGKAATVAGIALALATPAAAQTVDTCQSRKVIDNHCDTPPAEANDTIQVMGLMPQQSANKYQIKGTIHDSTLAEPLPFANILVQDKEGLLICGTQSDIDGNFTLKDIDLRQAHHLKVTYVGYTTFIYDLPQEISQKTLNVEIDLGPNKGMMLEGIVVIKKIEGLLGDPDAAQQEFERDGIKVKVKY
ncbi:MAG: carboxypeptidase-like regulatory domain-containing protein [Bacteroidales bacterium]|nr:carboxypeptidase-like regulatory domain-containing protein [Bacteroidales bacterium]